MDYAQLLSIPKNIANGDTHQIDQSLLISETEMNNGVIPASLVAGPQSQTTFSIKTGSVLIAAHHETTVTTPLGQIKLSPKSLSLILSTAEALAIYDFDDNHFGSVKVETGNSSFSLAPGQHVLITRNTRDTFENINPAQLIPLRNLKRSIITQSNQDGTAVYQANFHIPHALNTVQPIKEILLSRDANYRKLSDRLLKTASILSNMYSEGEQFHQYIRLQLLSNNIQDKP
ncbi:MAG: hypothetical protein JSS86_19535 [Cyanobacteria bacterium SZAS LIN-2]|nr:hypothetical protein [Cyanobacteria bacterium SZAS LIN-2]